MEALLFPQKIKTASRTSFALQNQLYQRIEEKVLRDRITRTKDLSYRENNVAVFLAQGFIIDEIADVLSISPETVETHRKNIYSKLGIHRQVELVCWFVNQFFKGNIKN
jgi:DNA-binding NarL/FixJ family response regulator